jgi:Xaa-Pro dipeptidase
MKLREILGNSLIMEPTNLIQNLKLVRSPAELEYIRKAASIADAGMQTCVESISEGKMELEVVAEIYRTIMTMGSDAPASPTNFCAGENSCYSHWAPSERKLKVGDFIHNQIGPSYRQYSATMGRQLCLGQPTTRMKEVYQIARDAADAAIAEIKAGVPGLQPHNAAKKVITDAKMDQYRVHMTGYAIGSAFPPSFVDAVLLDGDSNYTLEAGMVVTIEPPVLIHEERLGARLIDNVLVTENGGEVLSRFTRDLITL